MDRTNFYTTGDAAKVLGLSARTVAKLMSNGDLRGYRMPSFNVNQKWKQAC